jgi:hypothetical protein
VATFNAEGRTRLGSYCPGFSIALGVENLSTWAHELLHAADHRRGTLNRCAGQDLGNGGRGGVWRRRLRPPSCRAGRLRRPARQRLFSSAGIGRASGLKSGTAPRVPLSRYGGDDAQGALTPSPYRALLPSGDRASRV